MLKYDEVVKVLRDIYQRKNHDYGGSFDESLNRYGLIAAEMRMRDKLNRFEKLIAGEQKVNDESVLDTLRDLANYSIMTIRWLEDTEGSVNLKHEGNDLLGLSPSEERQIKSFFAPVKNKLVEIEPKIEIPYHEKVDAERIARRNAALGYTDLVKTDELLNVRKDDKPCDNATMAEDLRIIELVSREESLTDKEMERYEQLYNMEMYRSRIDMQKPLHIVDRDFSAQMELVTGLERAMERQSKERDELIPRDIVEASLNTEADIAESIRKVASEFGMDTATRQVWGKLVDTFDKDE